MGKSTIVLSAEDRTQAAFASVKKGLGEIDSRVGALKGTFSAFSALAATAGLTSLVTEAVAAASKAEQSSNRLNAVIRATGDTSGYTRGQLDKMAESLSKSTTFDDEGIRDAQSNLLKFGKLHGETFEHALKLSADYAAFTGGTMVEATQLIGKALADPVNGVTALGKAIGKLSQTEQDAIQTAMQHGNVADAQAVIFKKLEGAIGGTAGEMNKGIFGATTAATKAYDDFLKALGKTAPVQVTTTGALTLITNGLNLITEAILKQNEEWKKNPLFNGGQLQPLPADITGRRSSGTAADGLPKGMTTDEARAQGAAERARMDEAAQARREAAAALEKKRQEELKKAFESSFHLTEMMIDSDERWDKAVKEHTKTVRDLEDVQFSAAVKMLESQAQEINGDAANMQEILKNRAALDADKAKRLHEGQIKLTESLMTEDEIRKFHYEEDFNLLNATLGMKREAQETYYTLMGRLVLRNEKERTRIEDEEIKKRYGIANVYRKADVQAASFFFDQLSGLMQTKNRVQFEIGKAAAIAGAVVDTYRAANGAYAALASIPFVGPALGVAAAAAAVAIGIARVQAIKSTSLGSNGGAVGTFAASPNTGLPELSPSPSFETPSNPIAPTATPLVRNVTLTILGEGLLSTQQVRDLIPLLNDAIGDGVKLTVQ